MHPAIPFLMDVQQVDHQIAALQAELESFPKLIRNADAKLSDARAELATAKEAHTNNLKERKKLDLDVAQWRDRARKYRDQSSSVKTNEAYKALQQEIANAEAEATKAEDRELEVMMAGDEAERRVKMAEVRLKEADQGVAKERAKIEAQQTEKKKELAGALELRESTFVRVPEDLRQLYTRIAKRHHGSAMAQVRDDQCRGCGMRVLPHIIQELRRDANEEIYHCETCGRILYTLEPQTVSPPTHDSSLSSSSAHTRS